MKDEPSRRGFWDMVVEVSLLWINSSDADKFLTLMAAPFLLGIPFGGFFLCVYHCVKLIVEARP